jgi:hypothetical protein
MIHKPIYSGLLHTGLPDLQALYKMPKIRLVNRTSYAGWTDPQGLPTAQWYDLVAANEAAQVKIIIDHEAWPYSTQVERHAVGNKYVQIYAEVKSRRPDIRIGWYMDPTRRDFWRARTPLGSTQYLAWQAENNDLGSIMAMSTDMYFPSLYFFYNRDTHPVNTDEVGLYVERNIDETKRIRRLYGHADSPIYPYVWWMRHDNSRTLDQDVWETIVRTVMDDADGMVIWGGWQVQWDEAAPWWIPIKARLMDARRTG